jgi:ParB/RepB/Spo0J family partition protein
MNFDASVLQVAIEDIIPNRFQPRLVFEDTSLNELAESIKQHGIIQPLVLRRIGEKYEIVAGERRYRAAKIAGLVSVPAVISQIDDKKSAEIAIAENVQRKELNPIEEAKSYQALLDQGYMNQAQLAMRLGISESALANKLKLLTLAPEVQRALLEDKISERHARSLLLIKDQDAQIKWLTRVINERMTVRLLDLELRKEYGESYMNNGLDINKIKQNATDIPIAPIQSAPVQNEVNVGPINLGQMSSQNKFFNSLENEAVNMQMTETVNPFLQQNSLFDTTVTSTPTPMPQNVSPTPIDFPTPEIQNNPIQSENPSPLVNNDFSVTQNIEPTPIAVPSQDISQPIIQNSEPVVNTQSVAPTPIDSLESLDSLSSLSAMQPSASPEPFTMPSPEVTPAPVQAMPATTTKSISEVKSKINSLVEELRALGYNVSNSETEMGNSASFSIMVNIN